MVPPPPWPLGLRWRGGISCGSHQRDKLFAERSWEPGAQALKLRTLDHRAPELGKMLLVQPLAAQGLGLWEQEEPPHGLDTSFSSRAIIKEAWRGVGVGGAFPQIALWPLASSRTGTGQHDRWPGGL